MKIYLAIASCIALAGCNEVQLRAAAVAGCDIATAEAAAHAQSDNPKVQLAVAAVNGLCANPAASVEALNAARVNLKNALKN